MHDRLALEIGNLQDIKVANVQTKAGVLKAFMASLALVRDYAWVKVFTASTSATYIRISIHRS